MKQRVHLEWIGGWWQWKATTHIDGLLYLEIGRTKKGAVRRLRNEIRKAALSRHQPETVVMEVDLWQR